MNRHRPRSLRYRWLHLVLAVLAAGCSKPTSSESAGTSLESARQSVSAAGSCLIYDPSSKLTVCSDWVGSGVSANEVKSHCNYAGGAGRQEYSPSPCPVEHRIGSCLMNSGTDKEMYQRHYRDRPDATWAQMMQTACTGAKGIWSSN